VIANIEISECLKILLTSLIGKCKDLGILVMKKGFFKIGLYYLKVNCDGTNTAIRTPRILLLFKSRILKKSAIYYTFNIILFDKKLIGVSQTLTSNYFPKIVEDQTICEKTSALLEAILHNSYSGFNTCFLH